MLPDFKFALRQLAKSRGFTFVALVTLVPATSFSVSAFPSMAVIEVTRFAPPGPAPTMVMGSPTKKPADEATLRVTSLTVMSMLPVVAWCGIPGLVALWTPMTFVGVNGRSSTLTPGVVSALVTTSWSAWTWC